MAGAIDFGVVVLAATAYVLCRGWAAFANRRQRAGKWFGRSFWPDDPSSATERP